MYQFHEFPKWVHHPEKESKIVHSREEQEQFEARDEAKPAKRKKAAK